jgi:iron complex transport system substrate-binding protein
VREGRTWLADGFLHFNRPGPRIAESLEIYAEILWPEACAFGRRGTAFERF